MCCIPEAACEQGPVPACGRFICRSGGQQAFVEYGLIVALIAATGEDALMAMATYRRSGLAAVGSGPSGGSGEPMVITAPRAGSGEQVVITATRAGSGEQVVITVRRAGRGDPMATVNWSGGSGDPCAERFMMSSKALAGTMGTTRLHQSNFYRATIEVYRRCHRRQSVMHIVTRYATRRSHAAVG